MERGCAGNLIAEVPELGEAAALQSFGTVAVEVVKAEFVVAGLFAGQLPGQRARGAIYRSHRLDEAPSHSWKARGIRTSRPRFRSPPYEAQASPRRWSRATHGVPLRVDQVLRRHAQIDGMHHRYQRLAA